MVPTTMVHYQQKRKTATSPSAPIRRAARPGLPTNRILTLKATDEASAAAAIDARTALLKTLKNTDLVVCKEFAVTGIQRSDKLDATSQKLMSDLLAALEKAYRSGRAAKAAGTPAPAVASDAEARTLLTEAWSRLTSAAR